MISKERFDVLISLLAAKHYQDDDMYLTNFAHALIKAIEAECEVVGYRHSVINRAMLVSEFKEQPDSVPPLWVSGTKLIALPLVSEE
jgi:hypothetical protein